MKAAYLLLLLPLLLVGCEKNQSSNEETKKIQASLRTLETKLNSLEKRLSKIEVAKEAAPLANNVSPNSNVDEAILTFNQKLYELEEMLKAAGLDTLSTNEELEASIVTELVEERALSKKREKFQTSMRELRATQSQNDDSRYGQALTDLREKASFRNAFRGGQNETEEQREARRRDREAARDEIISRYPDSYAAAQCQSELVMGRLFQNDYKGALENYNEFIKGSKSTELANDFGGRTATSLQYALAQRAIQEGDYTTANSLISALESSSDDLVFAFGGPGGGRRGQGGRRGFGGFSPQENLITPSQAAGRLRESMK